MTAIDVGPSERFEFGRVVGQTLGLILRNFVLFVLLALLFVGLPQFGVLYGQQWALSTSNSSMMTVLSLGGGLVSMIFSFVLQGALTRAAVDDLSGSGVRFGAALGDGLRYFFPLFVVALLVGIGTMLGFIFLIVPGIILAVRWAVTAPVVVLEQLGPTRSMGRSAELSEDHRWAIFGLVMLYVVVVFAAQFVLGMVLAAFGAGDPTQFMMMDGFGLIYAAVSAGVTALVTLLSTVGSAALYFELRRVKEGVGVSELAKVFD